VDLGLFLLHVVVGGYFAGHGAQKLFGAFGGHGLDGTADFMESLGLHPGRLHARAAGTAEFAGGLLLMLGLFVPLAGALIVATMVTAILTAHRGKGPWATDGGWELNLVYIVAVVALAGTGGGSWSLDYALGLSYAGTDTALAVLGAGLLGGWAALLWGRSAAHEGSSAHPSSA
jgi:putative oxidoreductase